MKDVSIIIVSYNTRQILNECLESIKNSHIKSSYEVIIVDNASTDGSVEMVKRDYKDVILIENKENVGFSTANNIGVQKSQGRLILFLNSDTVVYENSIDEIVTFLDGNTQAGAATCTLELPNGNIDDASHRGFPTPWNAFTHFSKLSRLFPKTKLFGGYNLTWMNMEKVHEIDALAGAYMMVKRQAGEEVGWWDEDFFWYGDDLDFCYRLKQKGWKIYYVPSVKVLHYKGVSGGIKDISKHITTADEATRKKATQARFQAMKVFYNKHYKNKYPGIVTQLVFIGIRIKKLLS
jgi:GT2 family glycosyltransferase